MRESAATVIADVIAIDSVAAMRALGARLAQALRAQGAAQPVIVTLSGELGAGKTTLVGGLLAALGHAGAVRSPTYTLIEPYQCAGLDVYHCDLYRLRHPDELEDLGLLDLLVPGSVLLIEWPEQAGTRFAAPDLAIRLDYGGAAATGDGARSAKLTARGERGAALLAASVPE